MAKFITTADGVPTETIVEWKSGIDEDGDFMISARNVGGSWYQVAYFKATTGEFVRFNGVKVDGIKVDAQRRVAVGTE